MNKKVIHSHKISTTIYFDYFLKNLLQSCRKQVFRNYTSIFNFKHVWFFNHRKKNGKDLDPCTKDKEKTFYDYIIQIRFIFHKRTGAVARTQHIFIKAEKRS